MSRTQGTLFKTTSSLVSRAAAIAGKAAFLAPLIATLPQSALPPLISILSTVEGYLPIGVTLEPYRLSTPLRLILAFLSRFRAADADRPSLPITIATLMFP